MTVQRITSLTKLELLIDRSQYIDLGFYLILEVKIMKNSIKALVASTVLAASLFVGVSQSHANPSSFFTQDRVVFKVVKLEGRNNYYATVPVVIRETFDRRYPGFLGDYPVVKSEEIEVASTPLIIWQATLASSDPKGVYTPKRRAEAVSTRLTNLVATLGISDLKEMSQAGVFNHEGVIFISNEPVVDLNNVVFTLAPYNRDYAPEILLQLKEYGEGTASDYPIYN